MLIAAIVIYRPSRISRTATTMAMSWLLLCLCSAIFGYTQVNFQFYFYSVNQILTVFLFILLLAICLEYDQRSRGLFVAAICSGLLYSVLAGLYQYFWGFDEVIALYNTQLQEGTPFAHNLSNRVNQTLVYSTFTLSNNFAAHIILVLPLFIYIMIKHFNKDNLVVVKAIAIILGIFGFCNCFSSGIPVLGITSLVTSCILILYHEKLSAKFFQNLSVILIIATITSFLLTRSRAAFFCLVAGLLFCGLFYGTKKQKILCLVSLLCAVIGAAVYAPQIASFQARLGYYDALLEMFSQKPLGFGFGRFAEVYNQVKEAGVEESNAPHALFLGFLAQGGIFSGLAALLCFLFPFISLYKSSGEPLLKFCLAVGLTSWFIHAQLDVNVMIPGSLVTVGIITLLHNNKTSETSTKSYSILFTAMIPVLSAILYFHFINVSGERKYSLLYSKLIIDEQVPTIAELQNSLDEISQAIPYSKASYNLVSHWAIRQVLLSQEGGSLKYEYLKLAKSCTQKAIAINPHESELYAHLADIYFFMDKPALTLSMLKKALHYYPHSPSALQREHKILREYIRRQPGNQTFRKNYLNNLLKNLEITLGKMFFSHQLKFRGNELKDLKTALDKQTEALYTEIDFLVKSGFKLNLSMISHQLSVIIDKANKIMKTTQ
jgi:hypothetical protein